MSGTRIQELDKVPSQKGIYYPRTLDEVKTLIKFASANHFQIRTIGSAHSPQAAIYDAENKNQIKVILDGDFRKINYIKPDESKEFATASVGAGCYLGINPADKNSKLENSFNYQIDQCGYALPTLGGISHQTIAGFLQTSSSGGSAKHSIADAVEAIEWINGKGEECKAKRGDKEFDAVVVSMGLYGIITNVTFTLPKKYLVKGIEENKEFKDSFLVTDEKGSYTKLHDALFADNEYIHINWLPQKYVGRTMQWTGKAVAADLPIKPYEHPLSSKFKAFLATIALKIGSFIDIFGHDNDKLEKFKAELLKLFSDPKDKQEFQDVWYKALPIDDQANVDGAIKTLFSELWFPHDKMDEVMARLEKLFATHSEAAGNFIVELYCAKKSPYWLSPSYGHDAFRVDLYWWDNNFGDANKYFGIFWDALLDIEGARLHWGKYLPIPDVKYGLKTFTSKQLFSEKNYPKLPEWLELRDKNDPQQIFVTQYWRQVLDIPVKPQKELQKEIDAGYVYQFLKYVGFHKETKNAEKVEQKTSGLRI